MFRLRSSFYRKDHSRIDPELSNFLFSAFSLIQRDFVTDEQYAVLLPRTRLWSQDEPDDNADCSSVTQIDAIETGETVPSLIF
jgi:hypothetical protein